MSSKALRALGAEAAELRSETSCEAVTGGAFHMAKECVAVPLRAFEAQQSAHRKNSVAAAALGVSGQQLSTW